MTIEQQAEAIVGKYMQGQPQLLKQYLDASEHYAIICAITEVEACIVIYKQLRYRKAFEHYQQILSHLKQM